MAAAKKIPAFEGTANQPITERFGAVIFSLLTRISAARMQFDFFRIISHNTLLHQDGFSMCRFHQIDQ